MLGILLAIIGAVMAFKATVVETVGGDKIGKWAWKPLVFILLANFTFCVFLGGLPSIGVPSMGLYIAIYALTIIAGIACDQFSLKSSILLATALAIGSYVAFIWAL